MGIASSTCVKLQMHTRIFLEKLKKKENLENDEIKYYFPVFQTFRIPKDVLDFYR